MNDWESTSSDTIVLVHALVRGKAYRPEYRHPAKEHSAAHTRTFNGSLHQPRHCSCQLIMHWLCSVSKQAVQATVLASSLNPSKRFIIGNVLSGELTSPCPGSSSESEEGISVASASLVGTFLCTVGGSGSSETINLGMLSYTKNLNAIT
jgi:hypothetical protein